MLKHFVRKGLRLNCYAPGDGALSFVWVNPHSNHCESRKITPAIIHQFLNHSEGKYLKDGGYNLFRLNTGQLRLVAPIIRVNQNTLKVNGREFNYTILPHPLTHFPLGINDLTVLTAEDEDGNSYYKVKHVSTLASIAFFLNHEGELTPANLISPQPKVKKEEPTQLSPRKYGLQSAEYFNTPGFLRWAINGYKFKRDRKAILRCLTEGFSSPNSPTPQVFDRLLKGEIKYTVEETPQGGTVVFTA